MTWDDGTISQIKVYPRAHLPFKKQTRDDKQRRRFEGLNDKIIGNSKYTMFSYAMKQINQLGAKDARK